MAWPSYKDIDVQMFFKLYLIIDWQMSGFGLELVQLTWIQFIELIEKNYQSRRSFGSEIPLQPSRNCVLFLICIKKNQGNQRVSIKQSG